MLRHRDAYERSKRMIEGWKTTYAEKVKDSPQRDELIKRAEQDTELLQIEESLREFEDIVNGRATLTPLDELDNWASFLTTWRKAERWSVEELAIETGIDPLELLAYETHNFENCKFGTMRNIKDTMKYCKPLNPVAEVDDDLLGADLPPLDKLDEWEDLLLKWRLMKQWTWNELAERAGISLFDFLDYETRYYQECPYGVMRQIKEILKHENPLEPFNELDGPWIDPKE